MHLQGSIQASCSSRPCISARVQSRVLPALPLSLRHNSCRQWRRIQTVSTSPHSSIRRQLCAIVSAAGAHGFETGMSPQLRSAVDKMVQEHKIVLFMKGTPQFPQCGFSNTCIQILNTLGAPYETVNILESELLRQGMKEYSQWPTFPQVYIDGEFYGGCDIMIESYTNGELQETVEAAINS